MDYDDSKLRKFIGELLLNERKRLGLNQDSFAKSLKMKAETLRKIEKGNISARIKYLCKLFNELFGFDLENFIIKHYFNSPNTQDHANSPWQRFSSTDLIKRQTNHDQICNLIIDHLKPNPVSKPDQTQRIRSKEMNRRSTLFGLSTGVITGPALANNVQGWLTAFDQDPTMQKTNMAHTLGKLGAEDIDNLKQSARSLYESRLRYGGGPNRRIAIALLHEVTVAAQEKQTPKIQLALYNIMADLAETVAKMSWHEGLERNAQEYFQLALRAAHAGRNRLFGARVLYHFAWQMHHLGKPEDSLNLIKLAQRTIPDNTCAKVKCMLYTNEAWAYASLGKENDFHRTIALAQETMLTAKNQSEPIWSSFCNQAEITGMTGRGLRILASHKPNKYAEQASEFNHKAISQRRNSKYSRLLIQDYLELAESRFLLKDTQLAVNYTEKALQTYTKLQNRCGTTRRRLADMYQYTEQASKSYQLQQLKQKLKAVLEQV